MVQLQTIEQLLPVIPEKARKIVSAIHHAVQQHFGSYRIEEAEGKIWVRYAVRGLAVLIEGEKLTLHSEYDLRAMLGFFKRSNDEIAKELLFNAAVPCCLCIVDKCTTLINDHRICFNGQEKQLCGPYRHYLDVPLDESKLCAIEPIIEMVFEYVTPQMMVDFANESMVSYQLHQQDEITFVGYRHRSTLLSVKTENFIQRCFETDESGKSRLDALRELIGLQNPGEVIGVTRDFVDGLDYTYLLGFACPKQSLPIELPDGVEAVSIAAGETAVYTSSTGDLESIWRHFKDRFFNAEHKGYDTSRLFFERFDTDGRLIDVHIPVADGLPDRNGKRFKLTKTPDIRVAGFYEYSETDFPLNRELPDVWKTLKAQYPDAPSVVCAAIHARPGQPISHMIGVEIDRFDTAPEGMDLLTLRGGYWHSISFPYPVPGDYCFEEMYKADLHLDTCQHPRAFIEYRFNGRGAYSEIVVPVRITGERRYERVDRAECKLIGIQVKLPERAVSDADVERFRSLEANPQKGSDTTALHFEIHNNMPFFAGPIIKGFEVENFDRVPDGLACFTLPGGKYLKISESIPNGEFDWWTQHDAVLHLKELTGYDPDLSRMFFVQQSGFGRQFALFVPII